MIVCQSVHYARFDGWMVKLERIVSHIFFFSLYFCIGVGKGKQVCMCIIQHHSSCKQNNFKFSSWEPFWNVASFVCLTDILLSYTSCIRCQELMTSKYLCNTLYVYISLMFCTNFYLFVEINILIILPWRKKMCSKWNRSLFSPPKKKKKVHKHFICCPMVRV